MCPPTSPPPRLDLLKYSIAVYMPLDCIAGVSEETTSSAITKLRSAGAHIFDTHEEVMTAVQADIDRRRDQKGNWMSSFAERQTAIWEAS
jgi:hypothetical protein